MKTLPKSARMFSLATALVVSSMVTGCWTDDDDEAPPAPVADAVPDRAGSSSALFVSFLMGLAAGDETSLPLTIPDTFAPPADETADVVPLV